MTKRVLNCANPVCKDINTRYEAFGELEAAVAKEVITANEVTEEPFPGLLDSLNHDRICTLDDWYVFTCGSSLLFMHTFIGDVTNAG